MLKVPFTLLILAIAFSSIAQKYTPTDSGSKVHFIIKNFGINTGGDLRGLSGTIEFDPAKLPASNFNVSVAVKTIDTDNGTRDEHLRSDSYFDAEKFPEITIKSTRINKTNKSTAGWFYFTGTLTMHGVTKTILFPFTATPKGSDYLFEGKFEIDRLVYGVGQSSSVMGKAVKVSLSVLAKKS
jgi:polyisoprenoid-binding protein YceI